MWKTSKLWLHPEYAFARRKKTRFHLCICWNSTTPGSAYVPHSHNLRNKVIAIRREDASIWERRAPLSPSNVRQLVHRGVRVLVQPSNRRAYPMQTYVNAGASIQEDISEASVIFGVKQVPVDSLIPNRTYCFFSHTIKAQEANMNLLEAILEKNIRLVDYEKMVDANGQRVVAFGTWAGVAGMINILHGLGLRLLALGHHTPFMHIGPAHNYRNSSMANQAIRDAGYEIALGMMPKSIGPLTFVFTGSGNVSQGAQEIFGELPYEYVSPDMLKKVSEHGATNKLYACAVSRADHFVRKEGGPFNATEFEEHPERYFSNFSKKIAPYASVIINGIYWAVNSPKLITIPDAKALLRPASTPWIESSMGSPTLPHRLLAICDISADPGGSIEFMTECTTIDNPFCLYDADQNKNTESFAGPGVLVCSIDNMPTQLPREATDFFGDLLTPHVEDIILSDAAKPIEEHGFSQIVRGAIIASNGELTPEFQYIETLRNANRLKRANIEGGDNKKKVLILGAGYVAAPCLEYITRNNDVSVILASALKEEADKLAASYSNVEPILLNIMERPDHLEDLVKHVDLVISLLPYALHPSVAEQCIKHRVNMVTASYTAPQMNEMHTAAKLAGITVLNEMGLDPGIDHLLAMECFDEVHKNGGKVLSFKSYCGGLPAPECSDNPLRYKFNWSPRGVLLNSMNGARFKYNGKVTEIPEGGNLMDIVSDSDSFPGFNLECFPNRNSMTYASLYNIEEAHTIIRGTFRYKGFCDAMKALFSLGLINVNAHPVLHPQGPEISWKQWVCMYLGQVDPNIFTDNLLSLVYDKVGKSEERLKVIQDLGLLLDGPIIKKNTPLDTLTHYLEKRLAYSPEERDVVVLRHEFEIQWPDTKKEFRTVNLVCYGDPNGYSAMAKTVGYPTAIATKMILDGEIQEKGMVVPMKPHIYHPVLKRLKQEGISAVEVTKYLD